jgi:DNA repair protein RadC
MTITSWPDAERPREKLINLGCEALSDGELLAILLSRGTRGKNALQLAHELLQHYQGLQGLCSANWQAMQQHSGIGLAKYCQLKAALELSRRHLQEPITRGSAIKNSQELHHFLISSLKPYQHEVFACLFLDVHHRVIRFEKLFHGTIHSANVHPREVVKKALEQNAAAVIVAHNHPSGSTEPSTADIEITKDLKKALELMQIPLIDHLIIAGNRAVSLAQLGVF